MTDNFQPTKYRSMATWLLSFNGNMISHEIGRPITTTGFVYGPMFSCKPPHFVGREPSWAALMLR